MGTSPTSQSALLSGAAKDDALGADGSFTFSIADLLANDPGGAAKVDTATQFFFGDTAADQVNQAQDLIDHGIVDNGNATYTIKDNATDFSYFVQIGNKGTWSQGDVEVTAPEPHDGEQLFVENFDGYGEETQTTYYDPPGNAVFASVDLTAARGWQGTGSNAAQSELGADGYGTIEATSGEGEEAFWFDTQNSPGRVNITHTFTDTTAAIDGKTATLEFDIAKQSLEYLGNHYETAADAQFQVLIDGFVFAKVNAADLAIENDMYHFEIPIDQYADLGDDVHTITLQDTSPNAGFTGFAVDSITITDWIV